MSTYLNRTNTATRNQVWWEGNLEYDQRTSQHAEPFKHEQVYETSDAEKRKFDDERPCRKDYLPSRMVQEEMQRLIHLAILLNKLRPDPSVHWIHYLIESEVGIDKQRT